MKVDVWNKRVIGFADKALSRTLTKTAVHFLEKRVGERIAKMAAFVSSIAKRLRPASDFFVEEKGIISCHLAATVERNGKGHSFAFKLVSLTA